MYSKGANEIKEWMQALKKIEESNRINEEGEGNQDLGMVGGPQSQDAETPEDDEVEEEIHSSPFDILERVRDICNKNLKDPEDDEEIEKILKEIAEEVKPYVSSYKVS